MSATPTVVLVHGAFADASSFSRIIPTLLDEGVRVLAPAVPNRSLSGDAAYVASLVREVDGPVLLVGHSYGGAVITVAGAEDNVAGLVYLAGYALEEGESLGELQGRYDDPPLADALVYTQAAYEGSTEPGTDVTVAVDRFPEIFAADVDASATRVMAVTQRPLAGAAFGEPAAVAAWTTKPAWGTVSTSDTTINPEVQRFGYERAGMKVVEIDSSHAVMLSHPAEVLEVIREALATVAD